MAGGSKPIIGKSPLCMKAVFTRNYSQRNNMKINVLKPYEKQPVKASVACCRKNTVNETSLVKDIDIDNEKKPVLATSKKIS